MTQNLCQETSFALGAWAGHVSRMVCGNDAAACVPAPPSVEPRSLPTVRTAGQALARFPQVFGRRMPAKSFSRGLDPQGPAWSNYLDRRLIRFSAAGETDSRSQSPNTDLNALILAYMPLAHAAVERARRTDTGVTEDDKQEIFFAVRSAILDFRPDRGASFTTYLHIRLRGAILDAGRRRDFLPRAVRRDAKKLLALREQKGPDGLPLPAETVRAKSGLPPERFDMVCRVMRGTALRERHESEKIGGCVLDQLPMPEQPRHRRMHRRDLYHALRSRLTKREALVLRMLFFRKRTAAATAAALGITESRVYQVRQDMLAKLRGDPRCRRMLEDAVVA